MDDRVPAPAPRASLSDRSGPAETVPEPPGQDNNAEEGGEHSAAIIELLSLMKPAERAALLQRWRDQGKMHD